MLGDRILTATEFSADGHGGKAKHRAILAAAIKGTAAFRSDLQRRIAEGGSASPGDMSTVPEPAAAADRTETA